MVRASTTLVGQVIIVSMTPLSPRLRAIADRVPPGSRVADVGTDHGLLVRWLVECRKVTRAIASDVATGPLREARRNLEPLAAEVELRHGDGLSVLRPGEVEVVVIAGMGGYRMLRLTAGKPDVLGTLEALILQPNTHWPHVRATVRERRWTLVDEELVEDGGKFYVIFQVDPRRSERPVHWGDADLLLGPILRRRRAAVFDRWVAKRLVDVETAILRARRGARDATDVRVRRLEAMRAMLRDAMR